MKKIMQQYQVDKKNGKHGDCWESCILSITELDRELLPSVNDDKYKGMIGWQQFFIDMVFTLEKYGWYLSNVPVRYFKETGNYVIASGNSPRGWCKHAVVWMNGIVHDPHESGDGILTIDYFEYLEQLA